MTAAMIKPATEATEASQKKRILRSNEPISQIHVGRIQQPRHSIRGPKSEKDAGK
jgi:hypothetical protein